MWVYVLAVFSEMVLGFANVVIGDMLMYGVASMEALRIAGWAYGIGVILIPISFLAIRLAANFIHPVVFSRRGPQMAPSMLLVFVLSLAGMLALALTLYAFEVRAKLLDRRMRDLREVIA